MPSKRYGVFMGSFDPVHDGHVEIVRKVIEGRYVDTMLVVPAYQNPFKSKSTDFDMRVDMLRIAFADDIERGTVVIETVEKVIHEEYGDEKIPSWKTLFKLALMYEDISVVTTFETFSSMQLWAMTERLAPFNYIVFGVYDEDQPSSLSYHLFPRNKTIMFSHLVNFNCHSTKIRNGNNEYRQKVLNPSVYEYINKNKLYENDDTKRPCG